MIAEEPVEIAEELSNSLRILVVENSDTDFEIISKYLQAFGIATGRAKSLKEASRVDYEYDLILLDTSLPDACSPNVIKYFIETARAPLIVVSGATDISTFAYSVQESGSKIVNKSSFSEQFRELIREIIAFAATRRNRDG